MSKPGIVVLNKIHHPRELLCCLYTYDKKSVLTGGSDGIVRVYEAKTENLIREFRDSDTTRDPNPVTAIKINPSSNSKYVIAAYVKGYIKVWNITNGECLRTLHENRQILNLIYHPALPKFLTMGEDGQLRLYDFETGLQDRTFFDGYSPDKVEGHKSRVFTAKFNPKLPNEFISGGWDNTVQFWDLRNSKSCRYFHGTHICGEGLDIDHNGEEILTCSFQTENPLQLWSYKTGTLLHNLDSETAKLYCGRWIAPMFIATGSSSPTSLRVLNMYTYGTSALYKLSHRGVYDMDSYTVGSRGSRRHHILNAVLAICSSNTLTEMQVQYTYGLK